MSFGLSAARRSAFALAALLLISASPLTAAVATAGESTYASIGHAWLSVNSNLRASSHISAWAIDDWLARNSPLPPLGHAFKAAEAKSDVNARYLLAHAMHETAFGTSYIGQRFHNLFGWNAYDRDPTGMATRFPTYAASIDYVASQIAMNYLSPYGKFYGGTPTLRGMHYYASDPMWGVLIARIANGIVLSTLARRDITFDQPVADDASTGERMTVSVTTKTGRLPDGLEAAYRFIPVAIVEAGSPTGSIPAADPAFRLADGESRNDRLTLTFDAPTRAGRYRLELQLRDSDGSELTEFGVPEIPDTAVRLFGSDAVAYALDQTHSGLTVSVTNEGRRAIAPTGGAVSGNGAAVTPVSTTLTAWLVGNDGTPTLLAEVPLNRTLKPGALWTATLPMPDPTLLPAIIVVRLGPRLQPIRPAGHRIVTRQATKVAESGPSGGRLLRTHPFGPGTLPGGERSPTGGNAARSAETSVNRSGRTRCRTSGHSL